MVPSAGVSEARSRSAPRARGDGPGAALGGVKRDVCSPRTRGWSPTCSRPSRSGSVLPAHAGMVPRKIRATSMRVSVLPAHAGMVPAGAHPPSRGRGAPRARGDGPETNAIVTFELRCSPRTRGWSLGDLAGHLMTSVLPAHAGMVPRTRSTRRWARRAPRARGDGPIRTPSAAPGRRCSPRTRGWSHHLADLVREGRVLPAHAGMVPPPSWRRSGRSSAPRARGDGPPRCVTASSNKACSPRTRGWSPAVRARPGAAPVLPAHAGMVPWRLRREFTSGERPVRPTHSTRRSAP